MMKRQRNKCCIHTEAPTKNAVVLGMALENGKPTNDLLLRLDTAAKYLEENPESVAVLTGGNPDESGRTEAAVIRYYFWRQCHAGGDCGSGRMDTESVKNRSSRISVQVKRFLCSMTETDSSKACAAICAVLP